MAEALGFLWTMLWHWAVVSTILLTLYVLIGASYAFATGEPQRRRASKQRIAQRLRQSMGEPRNYGGE